MRHKRTLFRSGDGTAEARTGLLARSLTLLNAVDTGLDARNVLAVELPFSRSLYKGAGSTPSGGLMVEFDSRFSDLTERLREHLATLPGVVSATTAVTPPPSGRSRLRMKP